MCHKAEVRAIIAEKEGETLVTVRGEEISGSLSLVHPNRTLEPGTVVWVAVDCID